MTGGVRFVTSRDNRDRGGGGMAGAAGMSGGWRSLWLCFFARLSAVLPRMTPQSSGSSPRNSARFSSPADRAPRWRCGSTAARCFSISAWPTRAEAAGHVGFAVQSRFGRQGVRRHAAGAGGDARRVSSTIRSANMSASCGRDGHRQGHARRACVLHLRLRPAAGPSAVALGAFHLAEIRCSVLNAWQPGKDHARGRTTSTRMPASCCCTLRSNAASACLMRRLLEAAAAAPARSRLDGMLPLRGKNDVGASCRRN